MKKYFLSFTLLLVIFFLLVFNVQTSALAAQPIKANQPCTPGKSTCASGLTCRQFNADICKSSNNPRVVQAACNTECLPPLPKQQGQQCSGTGSGNCTSNLVCVIDQNNCKQVTGPGHITGQSCQTTCQVPTPTTPPPPANGTACKNDGDCGLGLVCTDKVCSPPNGVHAPCNNISNGGTSSQGTCAKGLICVGFSAEECNRVGINCTGTCTPDDSANNKPSTPPSPPCANWSTGKGPCGSFQTVFGNLSTSPAGFITSIFALLLSVSGGVALLLIIRAGYQLLTSQGRPEQLQEGRDQLIAVIVGLLFLIFAFVFLQVIGYDILRIPGF